MHKSLLLLLSTLLLGIQLLFAQTEKGGGDMQNWNWKKHVKQADESFEESQYQDAAYHYEQAWKKKSNKLQYAYKAGKAYLIIKDYDRASKSFKKVKGNYRKYPAAQFYYARSLKHNEQYEQAQQEFKSFAERYTGENAANMVSEALAEVEACELAKQMKQEKDYTVKVMHLDAAVNSAYTDFAPMPFGNDELLFSTTKENKAKIFSSKRGLQVWDSPDIPAQFAPLEDEHVCNAAFSPDEKRLYFTVCRSIENWGALTTLCEIYVTKRLGNLWSAAERLPNKINKEGVTSTQPFVVHQDGKEILYFASNRAGGQGGMDIWYATRDLEKGDLSFTAPRNVGAKINTSKNEITPYYNTSEQTLYFSSDGHMGMGGLDIFKASGQLIDWEIPNNIGAPYNSGTDDYSYVQNRYGDGGFFVSNRMFEKSKDHTTDEDIFEFRINMGQQAYVIKGIVYDKEKNVPLTDVEVSIFELLGDGREKMVKSATFGNGSYLFQVPANREYKIVANKGDFLPDTRTFATGLSGTQTEYLYLKDRNSTSENMVSTPVSNPVDPITTPTPTPPSEPSTPISTPIDDSETRYVKSTPEDGAYEYIYTPSTPSEAFQLRTSSPRHSGTYYKVQLIALAQHSDADPRFDAVQGMDRMDHEVIVDKDITRTLIGDYFDLEAAKAALSEVQVNGFEDAFIVRYKDGERMERVKM
ncbi:MAG: hypothetical protein AAGI49_12880 [Bacteroidota bacterium]